VIPPIESMSFPTKCPFPSCREKICKEWVLGVMPKFLGMVNAIIRCKGCERVYAFTMPVIAVEPFVDSLPRDESFPFDITKMPTDEPMDDAEVKDVSEGNLSPKKTRAIIDAFAVLDEYDALGYYGDTKRPDLGEDSFGDDVI
jgi:hypothetical protein